jgi:hypothetical protein
MKDTRHDPIAPPSDRHVGRRAYERPAIRTFTDEELLDLLGPAQGYSGDPIGTPGGSSF